MRQLFRERFEWPNQLAMGTLFGIAATALVYTCAAEMTRENLHRQNDKWIEIGYASMRRQAEFLEQTIRNHYGPCAQIDPVLPAGFGKPEWTPGGVR
jgi:hypothetical protein